MLHRIQQYIRFVTAVRENEIAHRDFVNAVYGAPSRVPPDYQRPAYLRRVKLVQAS